LLEMHVDYDGGNIIRETLRWTRFISIAGFVGVGLLVLIILVFGIFWNSIFAFYIERSPDFGDYRIWALLIMLLVTGILGFLVYMLFRFSSLTRRGIDMQDQALFQKGLNALGIYFTSFGIVALLAIGINIYSLINLL
jgi:multisubunit Na+/H+ antiporter MnhB subunit